MLLLLSLCSIIILLPFFTQGRVIEPRRNGGLPDVVFLPIFIIPIFLLGFLLVGLRPLDAGSDTAGYVSTYLSLTDFFSARSEGKSYYGNTEILWWPLQSLFSGFLSPQEWLAFNYILSFFLVFLVYRYLGNFYGFSYLIFIFVFFSYYIVYSGNTMRQVLSLPFGVLFFAFFCDRRYLISFLCLLCSIGLHWSSVFFLALPIYKLLFSRNNLFLILFPLGMLFLAGFAEDVFRVLIGFLDFPELAAKYELYFEGGRVSHVGSIWGKFNFWICLGASIMFLMICPVRDDNFFLNCYVSYFLGLMLLGVNFPDFSERFFPVILLVLPAMACILVRRVISSGFWREVIFFNSFFVLLISVLTSASSIATLGYAW